MNLLAPQGDRALDGADGQGPASPSMRRTPRIVIGLLALAIVLAAGGCGQSPETVAPDHSMSLSTTTEDTASTTEETASPFVPEESFRGEVRARDGSTFDLEVEAGALTKDRDEIPAEFSDLATTCELDPQRDAVVPIRLNVTSTNDEGFDQDISTGIVVSGFHTLDAGDISWEVAESFSDGPECSESQGIGRLEARVSFKGVGAGEDRSHELLLVIHDYFSPGSPEGREGDLADVRIGFPITGGVLTCFDAPGGATDLFRLDGSKPEPSSSAPEPCS